MDTLRIGLLLVIGAPLLGAVISGLFGRWIGPRIHWPSLSAVLLGCVGSGLICAGTLRGAEMGSGTYFWLGMTETGIAAEWRLDRWVSLLLAVLMGTGLIVHLYAIAEMKRREDSARCFSLLDAALFFSAIVVAAGNLVVLCVGWAGLGLCSYLSVELWSGRETGAGQRIFLLESLGVMALVSGVAWMAAVSGDTGFHALPRMGEPSSAATGVALLFLLAASIKGAQFPLHFWWADAVNGSASAQALVHAAASGLAAVHLLMRVQPLFAVSDSAARALVGIGAGSALLFSLMALAARDMRKVLAYSNSSQLGMAFVAVGMAGMNLLYLAVHTFGKALLFLGVGGVMRIAGGEAGIGEVDRPRRGVLFWTFLIGVLSLVGVPPLSGLWSSSFPLFAMDEGRGSIGWYIAGGAISLLTALYGFRLLWGIFSRGSRDCREMIRPSSWMIASLVLLAILAGGTGVAGAFFRERGGIEALLEEGIDAAGLWKAGSGLYLWGTYVVPGAALLGSLWAWLVYGRSSTGVKRRFPVPTPVRRFLENDGCVPAVVEGMVVRPVEGVGRMVRDAVDTFLIDLLCARGCALFARCLGWGLGRAQTGRVRFYAAVAIGGASLLLLFLFSGP